MTALPGIKPRRARFALVAVDVRSALPQELKLPAAWFKVVAAGSEYPEYSAAHPGIGALIRFAAPGGAKLLDLPYSSLPAGGTERVLLVFDLPAEPTSVGLVVSDELARPSWKSGFLNPSFWLTSQKAAKAVVGACLGLSDSADA